MPSRRRNLNDDNDTDNDGYFEKLKSIIHQLRKDLKNDKLIFIAGELNKDTSKNIRFKSMLARLETEIYNAGFFKSEGTKPKTVLTLTTKSSKSWEIDIQKN